MTLVIFGYVFVGYWFFIAFLMHVVMNMGVRHPLPEDPLDFEV